MVQGSPSSAHAVPAALTAFEGQTVELPGQVSAISHSVAAARQTVPEAAFPVPEHTPALSHLSPVEQALPSSHATLFLAASATHLLPVQSRTSRNRPR